MTKPRQNSSIWSCVRRRRNGKCRRANGARRKPSSPSCSRTGSSWHDGQPASHTRFLIVPTAMEKISQRYPDDYEAGVFHALTLQASASKSDTSYANQIKSAAILEKLYEQNPQHPGVSHFIIHAYDFAPLADKGIAPARRYA